MEEETKAISEVSVTKIVDEADHKDDNIKVSLCLHSLIKKLLTYKVVK